jgi:hypothetical protein
LNDKAYKSDKIGRLLALHGKRNTRDTRKLRENIIAERESVVSRIKNKNAVVTDAISANKRSEGRQAGGDNDDDKHKRARTPSEAELMRSALMSGAPAASSSSNGNGNGNGRKKIVKTLQEHLAEKTGAITGSFPVPQHLKVPGQKFVAFSVLEDLENVGNPAKSEPIVIWFRTFDSREEFDSWMEDGASTLLQFYDVDLVDMYEWLHVCLSKDEKRAIPTKHGNGETDSIFQHHAKQHQMVKKYEQYCKNHGKPVSYTEMTPTGMKEYVQTPDGQVQETPRMSLDDVFSPKSPTPLPWNGKTSAQAPPRGQGKNNPSDGRDGCATDASGCY